ncbi:MAG TPA: glycosyltransferase family 2 protein [Terracidiphilus sp.]|nr:glycosyltransferase family 2 protein [Terracidiphilus sp.]
MRFSICIPAFNRPLELSELLHSIAQEPPGDWEIVVSEDCSPSGAEIASVVERFAQDHELLNVRFLTTPANLGYDGNLRFLIDNAKGHYCVFMGDDDLWCGGALRHLTRVTDANPDVGVILRAWQTVAKGTGKVLDVHRYFPGDRVFKPGPETVAAFFRRSVFFSGLTIRTDAARAFATNAFDGTLLYQLHLVGNILMSMDGYYLSQMTAIRRAGGEHYFGSSENESGRFAPRQLSPEHSLNFVRGMFTIAASLDSAHGQHVGRLIRSDIARYSYSLLAIQARANSRSSFQRYASALAELGLGRYILFRLYRAALTLAGFRVCDWLIEGCKRVLGSTPVMSGARGARPS